MPRGRDQGPPGCLAGLSMYYFNDRSPGVSPRLGRLLGGSGLIPLAKSLGPGKGRTVVNTPGMSSQNRMAAQSS